MAINLRQEREHAHALIDLLPLVKPAAVRSLLEVMVDGAEPVTEEDRIQPNVPAEVRAIEQKTAMTVLAAIRR